MFDFLKKTKKEPQNLKEVLKEFGIFKKNFEKLSQELEDLKEKNKFFIQKLAVIRFNPFKEVGGDQSFSIAFLDGNNNGMVITSLYTREENRVYAKPIKNGVSQYSLSDEEIKVLDLAKNYTSYNNGNNEKRKSKFNYKAASGGHARTC